MIDQIAKKIFNIQFDDECISNYRHKKCSRWSKTIAHQEKLQNVVLNDTLQKLRHFASLLNNNQDNSNILNSIIHELNVDPFFLRCLQDNEISILKIYTKILILRLCQQSSHHSCSLLCKILSVLLQTDLNLNEPQIYLIINSLLQCYRCEPNKNTELFTTVNYLIGNLLNQYPHPVDCSKLQHFLPVYNNLTNILQQIQAVQVLICITYPKYQSKVTLYDVVKKKNILNCKQISWIKSIVQDCSLKLHKVIEYLCEGYMHGPNDTLENDPFYLRLYPKFYEHIQFSGFVSENLLFQEAYQMFNIEGICQLLISIGHSSTMVVDCLFTLFAKYDYFPRSLVNILKDYILLLDFSDQIDIKEISSSRNIEIIHRRPGIIIQTINFVKAYKWEWLPLIEIALSKKQDETLQLYIMENELMDFLVENLMKKKISLQYVKRLLILHNQITLRLFQQKVEKIYEDFINLISVQLDKSYNLMLDILATAIKIQSRFYVLQIQLKVIEWFCCANLLKCNDTALTTFKILLWYSTEFKQQLAQTWMLLRDHQKSLQMKNQLQRWICYYDQTDRLELKRRTGLRYNILRKSALEMCQLLGS